MDFNEIKIYGKVKLSDVFKEIHTKTQKKEENIQALIMNLSVHLKTAGDAVILVPLITKYMDISVKNDDNLIKMIGIVQRAYTNAGKNNNDELQLTDEEKDQLLEAAKELKVV
jgi:hypothetical protein